MSEPVAIARLCSVRPKRKAKSAERRESMGGLNGSTCRSEGADGVVPQPDSADTDKNRIININLFRVEIGINKPFTVG